MAICHRWDAECVLKEMSCAAVIVAFAFTHKAMCVSKKQCKMLSGCTPVFKDMRMVAFDNVPSLLTCNCSRTHGYM